MQNNKRYQIVNRNEVDYQLMLIYQTKSPFCIIPNLINAYIQQIIINLQEPINSLVVDWFE